MLAFAESCYGQPIGRATTHGSSHGGSIPGAPKRVRARAWPWQKQSRQ